VAVGQIDRVKVVIGPGRKLPKARPVDVDFVKMKRLFVVGLVTEQDLLGIKRNIRSPETPRFLARKLLQLAPRMQTSQDQQSSACHSEPAVSVTDLVWPLTAEWIGIIYKQDAVEVYHGVAEHDPPFDLPHSQVRLSGPVTFSRAKFELLGQPLQFG
jgi:hypothetical protein